MKIDNDRIMANVQSAETEDLIDRATIYRDGMEPEVLVIIEQELASRGVTRKVLEEHTQAMEENCLRSKEGFVLQCSLCRKPAVVECWGWYRFLWRTVPILPRRLRYCAEHKAEMSPNKNPLIL